MRALSFPLLALLLALTGAACADVTVPVPDPAFGDGRVSDFYRWPEAVPAQPGRLLRQETLPPAIGLGGAGRQYRLLYSSTSGLDGRTPVAVSGALFIPSGSPPAGGWPLVSWGHGTVGVADICAPSWQGRSYRDVRYLNRWLAEGFAVVATDYEGLGTPGGHPLLNNRTAAYGILDAVRAARTGFPELANKVLIVGQSQGGAGAVAAAAYAQSYAPDIGVIGTVATGVIYNPPGQQRSARAPADLDKVDETIAYQFYSILSAALFDPTIQPADILSAEALPLLDQARSACLFPLESDVVGLGLTRRRVAGPHPGDVLDRWFNAFVSYPTLKLSAPLFIGAGGTDGSTTAATQTAIAKAACEAGTVVEAHVYEGQDHSGTVNRSLEHSLPFARRLLAGQPVPAVCEPVIER